MTYLHVFLVSKAEFFFLVTMLKPSPQLLKLLKITKVINLSGDA